MGKGMNGNTLKLLAMAAMVIDHIGYMLLSGNWNQYMICRMIGRLAFPIFCFLLVEGFVHTRNLRRYATGMLIFGFLSEIPFDVAFFKTPFYWEYQNIYFTLFIGLLVLTGLKRFTGDIIRQFAVFIAGCAASMVLKTDYQLSGIVLISGLYLLRDSRFGASMFGAVLTLFDSITFYGTAALAFIPIGMYNGKRGTWNLKYLFYWFYPVHLIILSLIAQVIA